MSPSEQSRPSPETEAATDSAGSGVPFSVPDLAATPQPVRLRLSRAKGWRLPEGAVVVSRPSKWGNPYRATSPKHRAEAVDLHHRWILGRSELLADMHELAGRDLACWCPLDGTCHADTLLELANAR